MLAVKGNREVRIEEHEKSQFVNEGFDIYSDDIELIEKANSGDSKVVELEEINTKLEKEIIELKKENAHLKGQITKLKKSGTEQ